MQVVAASAAGPAPVRGGADRPHGARTAWWPFLVAAFGLLLGAGPCTAGEAPATAGAGVTDAAADPAPVRPALELTVQRAQLTGEGSLLEVRFKVAGATRLPVEPAQTYVVDEASGDRLEVANLVRVGPLAQRHKRADGSSFMIFDNRFGRLGHGARVSLVVGGLRLEHVVVE